MSAATCASPLASRHADVSSEPTAVPRDEPTPHIVIWVTGTAQNGPASRQDRDVRRATRRQVGDFGRVPRHAGPGPGRREFTSHTPQLAIPSALRAATRSVRGSSVDGLDWSSRSERAARRLDGDESNFYDAWHSRARPL